MCRAIRQTLCLEEVCLELTALGSLPQTVCRALWDLFPAAFAFDLGVTAGGMLGSRLPGSLSLLCCYSLCFLWVPCQPYAWATVEFAIIKDKEELILCTFEYLIPE